MSDEVYSPLKDVMTGAVYDEFGCQLFNLFANNSALPLANRARNLMAFYLSTGE